MKNCNRILIPSANKRLIFNVTFGIMVISAVNFSSIKSVYASTNNETVSTNLVQLANSNSASANLLEEFPVETKTLELDKILNKNEDVNDNTNDITNEKPNDIIEEEAVVEEVNNEPEIYDACYTRYVNAAKLNVRVAPDKEAGLLGRLYNQNEVLVTGVVKDSEWVRINFKDWTEAYVDSEFLVDSKDETTYKTIPCWSGKTLNKHDGTVTGPSGKETFYNLNMNKVIEYVRRDTGYLEEYWVRDDGETNIFAA